MTETARRCWLLPAISALGAGLLVAAGPAGAEPPSAETVQSQLRAALSGTLGSDKPVPTPGVAAPASSLTVTRQADRYDILVPITGMRPEPADQPAGLQVVVHPIDAGRWAIDSLTLPSDSTITFVAPPGGSKNAGAAVMQVHVGPQTAAGVFDPTYATPSRLDASATGVRTQTSNADIQQQIQYDGYQLHLGLVPRASAGGASPGLDMDQTTRIAALHVMSAGKAKFSLDADRAALIGTVIDLSPDRVGALYGAVMRMTSAILSGPAGGAVPAVPGAVPGAEPAPVPLDRTTVRALLAALPGLADKMDVVESADGVKLHAADGHLYTFDHAAFGFGGEAIGGVLSSYLDISLDNLQSPDSPDNVRAALPRHLHLHPTLGGIGTAELLVTAAAAATMSAKGDSGPLIASLFGLFAHGGIRVGITDLALEVGDSSIVGSGQLTMPAPLPAVFKGEGRVVAKNFDALIARLQADPGAAQAAGMMMAAKQFAKPDGDTLVWNIAYHDGGVFVNGRPLSPLPPRPGAAPPKDQ